MRLGIDVGGTFTDLVAIDDRGVATLAKVPSTPDDPSRGVLDGLARLAETLALPMADLLAATDRIVHGTTVATNALIEGKGARTGMLVTAGHRDVIEMREGLKPVERYNMRMPPPAQLVPRALRLPVVERMRHDGRVEVPLDEKSLDQAIAALRAAEVEAVAVCFFHAWRDPRHEQIAAQALGRAMPNAYVALSSEVLPKIKEFERFSTTVVNAYVGPRLARYLARLGERLKSTGYAGPVLIMQSHGGVLPIEEAIRLAAGAV
jgi:N-methylhydantoinase A